MKAIILDANGLRIETLNGKAKNVVFEYSRAAWWDFTMYFAEKETIEFDYSKLIPIPHGGIQGGWDKVAFYRWDGKNLTQLSLLDMQTTSSIADYNIYWKYGQAAKNNTLKPPLDRMIDLLRWLAVIAILVAIVANILICLNIASEYKAETAPFSAMVVQNNQLELFNANQIVKLSALMNHTLAIDNYTLQELQVRNP